jgi:REP element-mobilizing transposase RayT
VVYHVINRGNNRQPVFVAAGAYRTFLKALADLKQRWPFACYGYCLTGNHFHLLLRPEVVPISRLMQSSDTVPWREVTSGVGLHPLFLRWRIRAGTRASRCLGLVDAETREIARPPRRC